MKIFLYTLLGLGVWSALATVPRWHYVCKMRNYCGDTIDSTGLTSGKSGISIPRTNDLDFSVDDEVIFGSHQQFGFPANSAAPEMTDDNGLFLDKLIDFLEENPNGRVRVTGHYLDSEKDAPSGIYENIGLARAAVIRDQLVAKGMENGRIALTALMVDDMTEPIQFDGFLIEQTEDYEFQEAEYTFKNMTISGKENFEFDSYDFKPSVAFYVYADSVGNYFKEYPEAILNIIGHTSDEGSDKYNEKLGRKRAEVVKNFFIEQQNITKKRIIATSAGEKKPLVNNDTEENRARNRRVNFQIKENGDS